VGVRFGKSTSYKILGQKKSLVGTGTFFVTYCLLVLLAFIFVPDYVTKATMLPLLLLPFLTTAAENIGVYGTDNLLIPLIVIIMLSA
jgi:dolichol kinase